MASARDIFTTFSTSACASARERTASAGIPADAVLSRADAQALVEKVVKMSRADAINVTLTSNYTTNVRFAANQMSTAGAITDAQVVVQSSFGPRHAVVTTGDLGDESLRRAVQQSETLAKLSPEDPEAMPELAAQKYV